MKQLWNCFLIANSFTNAHRLEWHKNELMQLDSYTDEQTIGVSIDTEIP